MYCVAVYIFPIVPQVKRASLDFEDGGILMYVQLAREKKKHGQTWWFKVTKLWGLVVWSVKAKCCVVGLVCFLFDHNVIP